MSSQRFNSQKPRMDFRSSDGLPRSTDEYGGDKSKVDQEQDEDSEEDDDDDEFNAGTPENYQHEEQLLYSAKGGQSDQQQEEPTSRKMNKEQFKSTDNLNQPPGGKQPNAGVYQSQYVAASS